MPLWISYTMLQMLGFSVVYICIALLARSGIPAALIHFYFFSLSSLCFLGLVKAFNLGFTDFITWKTTAIMLILVGFGIIGNYFAVKAAAIAPNPGYATSISMFAVVIQTLFFAVFMDGDFSPTKIAGVLITLAGVSLITLG